MTDEIIQEVWRAKERLARTFNYDVETLAAEMRRRQETSGRKLVDLSKASVQRGAAEDAVGPSAERQR
jgi:hypothetical protein